MGDSRSPRQFSLGILAALAVIALACGSQQQPPTTVSLSDSADQVVYGMRHYLTVDGVTRAHLVADTAFLFDDRQIAEIVGVDVTFFDSNGEKTSDLTSLEGTYDLRTGDMTARGDVRVRGVDGRRLRTEELRYDRTNDQIVSDHPFVFTRPSGEELTGEGFTSNPDFSRVITRGTRGPAGRVELPNR